MEEINENSRKNGEYQVRKEQPKMARTRAKGKKDVKSLVEAENGRENAEDTSIIGEKEWKDKPIKSGKGMND